MTTNLPTVLYRYNDHGDVVLQETYRIVSRTPCGVWIELPHYYPPRRKFVLTDARKRYAHETLEGAKTAFLARKARQLGILSARIDNIQDAVKAMQEGRIADYSKSRCFE